METYFPTMHEALGINPTEKVVEDLNALVRDAEDLLEATAGHGGEQAVAVRARLAATIESAKKTSLRFQDTARATDRIIRAHPYQSAGLAFGLGLLVGVLLGRR